MNNAGINLHGDGLPSAADPGVVQRVFDTNFLGALRVVQTMSPLLRPLRDTQPARPLFNPPDLVRRFSIQCWRFLANAVFRSLISIGWSHLNRKEFRHDRATPKNDRGTATPNRKKRKALKKIEARWDQ